MAAELTPIVFWGQKNDHISLKVDLRDVSVCILIALEIYAFFNCKFARPQLLGEVQIQSCSVRKKKKTQQVLAFTKSMALLFLSLDTALGYV